jgi:hypothetical protein
VIELLLLGVSRFAMAFLVAAFTAVAFMLRALIWLVLVPFKLLIGLILGIVVFPIVAVVSVIGVLIAVVTVGALVAVPLLPLLIIGLLVWAVVRVAKPAVA